MPPQTTDGLTAAYMSILTDTGRRHVIGLVLPDTGLGMTPSEGQRTEARAEQERWTMTHLRTGRAMCSVAGGLRYDTARRLLCALAALPIDWTAEVPTGPPEARAEARRLVREAKEGR